MRFVFPLISAACRPAPSTAPFQLDARLSSPISPLSKGSIPIELRPLIGIASGCDGARQRATLETS